MILNMPEPPHPIIHQDVYTPSSTSRIAAPYPIPFSWSSALLTSARKTTGNATDSVEYRWREPSVWDSRVPSVEGFDRARRFSAGLNMCTLLSLRRNNTRYLARDKCLSRRIPESAGPRNSVYFPRPVFRLIKIRPIVLSSCPLACRMHGGLLFVISFIVVANVATKWRQKILMSRKEYSLWLIYSVE